MHRSWRQLFGGSLLAAGMAVLAAAPAAAKDTYAFYGPLDIRIVGAGGDVREFTAWSAEDRTGALALVNQLTRALQEPGAPIQGTEASLPHYGLVVSHLGLPAAAMPWAGLPETNVTYYPGGDARTYLLVEFTKRDTGLGERWIQPSPAITAMLQRHLAGLPPIGSEAAGHSPSTAVLELAIGGGLLAVLSVLYWEDRRRWLGPAEKRSAGSKGT